ncbi:MAG: DUF5399 family protein [Chlamydiae bacterium]|nr:DUF5399 family protein [Chlamydiota bacterium]
MTKKTIDNLGIDISTRYAQDQEISVESAKLVKESQQIPFTTEVDVHLPFFLPYEFDLFQIGKKHIAWAGFPPLPQYREKKVPIFREQLIPGIRSIDNLDTKIEKINAIKQLREKEKKAQETWEEEKEREEEEREGKIILHFFEQMKITDQYLIDINSYRNQYQKA